MKKKFLVHISVILIVIALFASCAQRESIDITGRWTAELDRSEAFRTAFAERTGFTPEGIEGIYICLSLTADADGSFKIEPAGTRGLDGSNREAVKKALFDALENETAQYEELFPDMTAGEILALTADDPDVLVDAAFSEQVFTDAFGIKSGRYTLSSDELILYFDGSDEVSKVHLDGASFSLGIIEKNGEQSHIRFERASSRHTD